MKKFSLLSLLIFGFFTVYSQTQITLTFHAKDSITQNPLALDSVNIKNLTENGDTTLYDSISVLTMNADWPLGFQELSSSGSESFIMMQNIPNPFTGTTTVRIYKKKAGEMNLAVYDNQGKTLSQYHNTLEKGWHLFNISTNNVQLLFLTASDQFTRKTIKLLSTGSENENEHISYVGVFGQSSSLKSATDVTGFIFYLGNHLQYTAYVNGYYKNILSDDPVSNETYTFSMHPFTLPVLTTTAVTAITTTSATSGGNVTSDGGCPVTARGVCWGISSNPTIAGNHTTDGSGTGTFVSNLTGLSSNTPYYIRAYATNCTGTAYGNQINFTTQATFACGTVVNYGGQDYNTVLIGSQCWFKENLNIGSRINASVSQTNNSVIEKYCYLDQPSNCDVYGGLYQWKEMMQYVTTEGVQGICPSGWHIPDNSEWTTLANFLGGESIAGGPLKEAGTAHWQTPNLGATNSSGFTALPTGMYQPGQGFDFFPTDTFIWSSTQVGFEADMFDLNYNMASSFQGSLNKTEAMVVRCVHN